MSWCHTEYEIRSSFFSQQHNYHCDFQMAAIPWGGDSAYERGGDARRQFWIKPLKETDPGRGASFFWPLKETMLKHRQYIYFYIFSRATPYEIFTAKYDGVLPRTQKSKGACGKFQEQALGLNLHTALTLTINGMLTFEYLISSSNTHVKYAKQLT